MTAIVALWTLAVVLASVFAVLLSAATLGSKYQLKTRLMVWAVAAVIGYSLTFASYMINLYNDTMGILGLSAIVCIVVDILYEGSRSAKLFVSLISCLIANVTTFMFCGTTDTLLAGRLGLIKESPYEVSNILFFIGLKLVFYTAAYLLYKKLLRGKLCDMIQALGGKMKDYVLAPLISVIGFYVINLFTNQNGIFPSHFWFFPLYLTVCVIFIVEFVLIINSVMQTAAAMKNEAELSVATNIQHSMLPCIFPAFPERQEFDVYATMNPAKEVGGDFYDFFMVDDRHLAIVIADVSGKGIPAALFMVIGKTLIKDHTQPGRDLGEVFAEVNNLLCESNSEGLFITAFEGVLDLVTGEFVFVNAGHEAPYIAKKGKEFEMHSIRPGFVLAGMEDIRYRAGSMMLEEGDKLFQYTDGVTEATDAHNELYGKERLQKILASCSDLGPADILPAVKDDIEQFVGAAPQFDDITMLCLEFRKKMVPGNEEEKSGKE